MNASDAFAVTAYDRRPGLWQTNALLTLGAWLLLAPSLWGLADGRDAWPLVPIPPEIIEPTRADGGPGRLELDPGRAAGPSPSPAR